MSYWILNNVTSLHSDPSWVLGFDQGWKLLDVHDVLDVLDVHDHTGLDLEVGAIWACQDFTAAVGATRVVLGSHQWPRLRMNKEREYPDVVDVAAEMSAGSAVLYLGQVHDVCRLMSVVCRLTSDVCRHVPQTWHAAGSNTTPDVMRRGLMTSYIPAFLAEEELQALANPPHTRARYLPALARILHCLAPPPLLRQRRRRRRLPAASCEKNRGN
eukprot:SAG22_NODE_4405_length_1281_cov_0.866328_2_plen_214_part_00